MKALLITLVLFACIACQKPKDWTCTCECNPTGGSSFTATTTITNAKQSAANSKCADYGKAKVYGNGSWKCTIK